MKSAILRSPEIRKPALASLFTLFACLALTWCAITANPEEAQAAITAGTVAGTEKCYTISSGNTQVYSNTGLSKKYGTIFGSDEVTVLSYNSTYTKVRYPISRGTKTGYVRTSTILGKTGYSSYNSRGKFTTYKRPGGTTYGYVAAGDKSVRVYGTSGSYTQIRYPISGGYKFAWAKTTDVNRYLKGTSSPSGTLAWYKSNVGKVIAKTSNYKTNLDGANGIKGQCVWYVRNRGYEKLGNRGLTGITGNGNAWWSAAIKKGKSRGATPRSDSIACYGGGSYGHVVYVEYYDSSTQTVYFTEGNYGSAADGTLKKLSLSSFKNRSPYGYQGCIYL